DLYDLSTGALLRSFPTSCTDIKQPAFSPDGTLIAIGGTRQDATFSGAVLEIWKVADASLMRSIPTKAYSLSSLAFSPDGVKLAFGGSARDSAGDLKGVVEIWKGTTFGS